MEHFEFRPLDSHDTDMVTNLIVRNNVTFDYEIPLRFLNSSVPPGSHVIGCFNQNDLVGMYMAYAFKLFFSGIVKDAVVATFNVVDKPYRKKGLGIKLGREMAELVKESGIEFVTSSINTDLIGKWSVALNNCWHESGYDVKNLQLLTPCFRLPKTGLPDISENELSAFRAKRLSANLMHGVFNNAEQFYSRYYISEIPDSNAIKQLALFPDKYFWYSISFKDRQAGYISCYVYRDRRKNKKEIDNIIFNNMMVDDIYLPGAVNAVISDLESHGPKYDLYVINNTSLTNKVFLYKTAFTQGFKRFQVFLRCHTKDKYLMEVFQKTDNDLSFSLPII